MIEGEERVELREVATRDWQAGLRRGEGEEGRKREGEKERRREGVGIVR